MSDTNRDNVIDRPPPSGDPELQERTKAKKPSMYNVIMLNDDYTPMDFVVELLQKVFKLEFEAATHIMLEIHHKGKGLCGTYSYEVAETKVTECMDAAKKAKHPLKVFAEKA